MSHPKPLQRVAFVVAACALLSVVAYAATTFLTVSPTNLQGWQIRLDASNPSPTPAPSVTFVLGPGTPPLGNGSVEFRVGGNGDNSAELRHPGYAGTALPAPTPAAPAANELSSLSYSTYAQSGGSGGQAPYLILHIDNNNDNTTDDLLFFEPVYQNGSYTTVDPSITIPNQCGANPNCVTPGQWQTWDALNGGWWSLNAATFGPPLTTLRFYRSQNPNARIVNASGPFGGVRIVTGGGAGSWDNFVGNADAFRIGVGGNDTVYNFDPNQSSPLPGQLIISEMSPRGSLGPLDEFVEVYNNTDTDHVVSPPDGSAGYGIAAEDGVLRCTVPFGTVIPARGHFLCAGAQYAYSSETPADANFDAAPPNFGDIGDSQGVALFSTNNPANFNAGTRLDAFGYNSSPALYREGAGYPYVLVLNTPHSYPRTQYNGNEADTDNNQADFITVNSRLDVCCDPQSGLGMPGPQNLASPRLRLGQQLVTLFDPNVGASTAPNRERSSVVVPNGQNGTLRFRRTITNNTATPVTRMRIRVVDITTLNTP
ncbi:MAG TPA: hypothetical protein VGX48_12700, partial [Pyrinomonadaceae bacterium]|nr:hypothetical protein [Pyrinomonadaceae bacterium]